MVDLRNLQHATDMYLKTFEQLRKNKLSVSTFGVEKKKFIGKRFSGEPYDNKRMRLTDPETGEKFFEHYSKVVGYDSDGDALVDTVTDLFGRLIAPGDMVVFSRTFGTSSVLCFGIVRKLTPTGGVTVEERRKGRSYYATGATSSDRTVIVQHENNLLRVPMEDHEMALAVLMDFQDIPT